MKAIEVLQGKWLGHPLHPAIVHVPVGAWTATCIMDVVMFSGYRSGALAHVALYSVGFGLLAALLAVPTGLADWSEIKKEKPAWKLGLYHLLLNAMSALGWAVNFGLRLEVLDTIDPVTPAVLTTSVVATVLLFVSAYLGSLMVFDHGVGVARQSKKTWRARAVRGGARVPEQK